ncbi:alpha/beta fold hydrolase [Pseudomonas sp. GD03944]|uniref:alpha/beta fold hydrolase n=1 Tax=Pseudomonas sp. GD03944 TaxID=2975409 RepID=UPI002446FF69|nr:alpha/beta fold hydrolase [Pseudomonas sp. GD03944]MDH1262454.1 alpha/beta fold hydrolase [Pseudomonas sp. GD03944]
MNTPRLSLLLAALAIAQVDAAHGQGASLPLGQTSFAAYREQTRQWLQHAREFQSPDHAAELDWNAPQEWRPEQPPSRGILLVHGLGDSPWSFSDLGPSLARQGFLVRTLLLPGHGSKPADLLDTRIEQWRQLLREQAAVLAREVPNVYLGGFSTGANLVLDYAYEHPEVDGLLLFSPAFKSDTAYDWLPSMIAWAKPWLRAPGPGRPSQTPVRYLNVPTNAFAQFYRSSVAVQARLNTGSYDKPVLVVAAQHDSVLDTAHIRDTFTRRFTHPASRLVWYGSPVPDMPQTPRVLTRSDALPEQRISQFSHMGVLFSPGNPLYGANGAQRICWNGQDDQGMAACQAGETVWYSDWGYREAGKFHARLTYNPYFEWQNGVMFEVLNAAAPALPLTPKAGGENQATALQ